MNSDVPLRSTSNTARNALRDIPFPSMIRLLGSPISTASIRSFACNRLCCITQVRNSRLVTASADWISDGHLRRTSQTSAGRLVPIAAFLHMSPRPSRRRSFPSLAPSLSHDRASKTLTAVHRHSPCTIIREV
jgi:hypothetical protein